MVSGENAVKLLKKICNSGYEAYLVGDCVRDILMGEDIHNFDITTSALPDDIMNIFLKYNVVSVDRESGKVTILIESVPYKITTYCADGCHSDTLKEALLQRDFTMNAIAMDSEGKIIDPLNGTDDIKKGIIRCVGEASICFEEDALRIMRAVRFSSQLGFVIEFKTSEALIRMRNNLNHVSPERIRDELDKLICGKNCINILLNYYEVVTAIIPEFSPCIKFDQHSDYHCYDVWEHIVRAIGGAPSNDVLLRRSLLFHDIGKPMCIKFDEKGKGHFKGHAEVSANMTKKIMKRLRYDSDSIEKTSELIRHHSDKIHSSVDVKMLLHQIGVENFFKLIEMKKCDNSSKNSFVLKENAEFDVMREQALEIISSGECYDIN